MRFRVKNIPIHAGNFSVVVFHIHDAIALDIYPGDRVLLKDNKKTATAMVDVTHHTDMLRPGVIGLFREVSKRLGSWNSKTISVSVVNKPVSVSYIKKKLDGEELSKEEICTIVNDTANKTLTETELTYFVAAGYLQGFSFKETVNLTRAMLEYGEKIKPRNKIVVDKHSIGGVPGNRTTPIVVPIVAAAGLTIPKTSSRSITSPSGTADTMEVIANVSLSLKQVHNVLKKTNACMIWGGALNLAPADDVIIKVEHPLSIDAEGQMIASVLSKKLSVGSNHILIDIPVAEDAKVTKKHARSLEKRFKKVAKEFGTKIKVIITDGRQPIGNGIGPALEARDVLKVLMHKRDAPQDLKEKAIMLAGHLLEMGSKAQKGKGRAKARAILNSGKAYKKFIDIVKAQGMKTVDPNKIQVGELRYHCRAKKAGKIKDIDNHIIAAIAKAAGTPIDKEAGIYLNAHIGDKVKKGDILFTIYARKKEKLGYAKSLITRNPILIK